MTISIVTCPKCGALVLGDTPECYACHHVLHSSAPAVGRTSLPTDAAVAEDLETCTQCGETYRKGLVRCWSCGSFTRQEIADAYQSMMAAQIGRTVGERVLISEASVSDTNPFSPDELMARQRAYAAGGNDQDFEVSASDDDFEFELADSVALGESTAPPISEDDAYRLVSSNEPPMPPAPPPPVAMEVPEEATPSLMPQPAEEAAEPIPPIAEAPAAESKSEAMSPPPAAAAGDALLDIAKAEEAEITRVKKDYRNKLRGSFLVYCPMGCRIRVQEKHRGKSGKCPRCGSVYVVPLKKKEQPKAEGEAAAPVVELKWKGWMEDVHLHSVVPQKLRIKADSLLNEFTEVDVGFSNDGLLQVTLVTSAGMFGANLKKKPTLRAAIQEHLKTVGKVEGLPAPAHRVIATEALSQITVVQPCPPDVESLFGNIPVFGANRIAVRVSKALEDGSTPYYSFALSQFRQFVKFLDEVCGVSGLGANTEVPLTDNYNTLKCHYTDTPVRELQSLSYYEKDKSFKLKQTGWRCGGCGLVVSEDGRKKEKIGGLNGRGIAKAKCPKCGKKFGSNPLYEVEAAAPTEAPAAPAEAVAT